MPRDPIRVTWWDRPKMQAEGPDVGSILTIWDDVISRTFRIRLRNSGVRSSMIELEWNAVVSQSLHGTCSCTCAGVSVFAGQNNDRREQ